MSDATRTALMAARARSGETMRSWRASAAHRAATAAFADCADCPERVAACAERLLADAGWAEALLAPLITALELDPLFEPLLKFHRDPCRTGAVLFDAPAASIAARVSSAAAMAALPSPQTIVFTGRITVTRIVKAGGAWLRRWQEAADGRRPGAGRIRPGESRRLDDGAVYRTDGRVEAQRICDAASDVVTLVATIRTGAAPLIREYDVASGALIRITDADDRPSRTAMLLRFLRVAGRIEAATCFEAASHAPDFHLRWAAMREWLALDANAAAPRLMAMAASDPDDEVRRAAARMLPLVTTRLAKARCPA